MRLEFEGRGGSSRESEQVDVLLDSRRDACISILAEFGSKVFLRFGRLTCLRQRLTVNFDGCAEGDGELRFLVERSLLYLCDAHAVRLCGELKGSLVVAAIERVASQPRIGFQVFGGDSTNLFILLELCLRFRDGIAIERCTDGTDKSLRFRHRSENSDGYEE